MPEHSEEDHVRYTKEQIAKQLILLEEHFKNYPCHECMTKHLLGTIGYSEEGIGMTGEKVFSTAKNWAERTLKTINKGTTDQELQDLASAARDLRRTIQEGAHLTEKEIEVSLQHDDSAVTVIHQ